jgi:hypothetical protein
LAKHHHTRTTTYFRIFSSLFLCYPFFTLQSVLIFYYLTIELADRKNIATTVFFNHLPMNVEKVIYSLLLYKHRKTSRYTVHWQIVKWHFWVLLKNQIAIFLSSFLCVLLFHPFDECLWLYAMWIDKKKIGDEDANLWKLWC